MMKKRLAAILSAALLAASAGACGTENSTPSGPEIPDTEDAGEAVGTETETESENPQNTASAGDNDGNAGKDSDTNVTSDNPDAGQQPNSESSVSVTFEESFDEIKADDGTVIVTNSVQLPVVSITGAADIAEKINADLKEYYKAFSTDSSGTVETAKEDYAASLGEDGWEFHSYSTMVDAKVTRMDDSVVSFQITASDYTGGAHGNYGSTGRNYSVKTGDLLAFDEISADYEAFHATVLDYMVNLADTPSYKDMLFGPPSKNDLDSALFRQDGWIFTKSGISFLVPPYVLGPYASGEISFRLPYEKAYDLGLKEDYRYSGNFVDERYYIQRYDPETFEPIVDSSPDCYFDLDGDGTEEGLAFYGQVVDPADGESSYIFYIDGKDYGNVIGDELQNVKENGYMENSYALYHAGTPDGGVPAVAVMFAEFGDEDSRTRRPRSFIFGYTKEQGLYYMYSEEGFVTAPSVLKQN